MSEYYRRKPVVRKIVKKGFTLIELLITTSIISLIGIAVYSTFANGVNIWRRGNENRAYERNMRLSSEKIARNLRNTFKFSKIPFEGTEDSITFPGLIKSSLDETGAEKKEPSEGLELQYEVGKISYFLDESENIFCREQKTYPETFQEENGKVDKLIPQVITLNFSYCYLDNATGEFKWKDSWKKEEQDSVPQAVKIELVFEKNSGESSEFTRTIFIPIGTGEQRIELTP